MPAYTTLTSCAAAVEFGFGKRRERESGGGAAAAVAAAAHLRDRLQVSSAGEPAASTTTIGRTFQVIG